MPKDCPDTKALLDRLREETSQEVTAAKARREAIGQVSYLLDQLRARGFEVKLERRKECGADLISIWLDLNDLDLIKAKDMLPLAHHMNPIPTDLMCTQAPILKMSEVQPEIIGLDFAEEETVAVILGDDDEAGADPALEEPPAEDLPADEPPVEDPPAELVTGPVSYDEAETIIDMTLAGKKPAEIAERLNCAPMRVSCWKSNNKDGIKAAGKKPKSKPKAPAKEPAPAAAPSGGKINHEDPVRIALPVPARPIFDHILASGAKGWTYVRDLALVEALAGGAGVEGAVKATGLSADDCRARWDQLNTKKGDLEHQQHLLTALRAIALGEV